MVSACSCGQKNISYGVMRDFRGTSQTFHEGQYCEGCGKTVPLGESHYYYTTEDRFSFTCSKCGHDYYDFSEPILAEHTITKKYSILPRGKSFNILGWEENVERFVLGRYIGKFY